MRLGNGVNSQNLLKLEYEYGSTASVNKGNVTEQTITVPGVAHPFIQTYAYDELNRLTNAEEMKNSVQQWEQTFTFDRYGNRNYDQANTTFAGFDKLCSGNTVLCADLKKRLDPSINTANNRLSTSDDYDFDVSGNTTEDPDGRTFVYDAENKQVSVSDTNGTIGEYFYDGDGKRVKKIAGSEETIFVYDAGGKLIGEYSSIVQTGSNAKTVYTTNDHLGSPRINTDATGQFISRHDYHPFGEEIARTGHGSDTIRKQFTGYERDGETGLDYAQARMFDSNRGRFREPDPLLSSGSPTSPQSWNRYIYVENNPLYFTDPFGLYVCKGEKAQCEKFADRLQQAKDGLAKIAEKYKDQGGVNSKHYKKAEAAIKAFGEDETGKKTNNGVFVNFNGIDRSETSAKFDASGKLKGPVTVSFRESDLDSDGYSQSLVVHEGDHVSEFQTNGNKRSKFNRELDAHTNQSVFLESVAPESGGPYNIGNPKKDQYIWNPAWDGPDKEVLRKNGLTEFLGVPKKDGGYYELSPAKPKVVPPTRKKRS